MLPNLFPREDLRLEVYHEEIAEGRSVVRRDANRYLPVIIRVIYGFAGCWPNLRINVAHFPCVLFFGTIGTTDESYMARAQRHDVQRWLDVMKKNRHVNLVGHASRVDHDLTRWQIFF